jgi:hypothetical protein
LSPIPDKFLIIKIYKTIFQDLYLYFYSFAKIKILMKEEAEPKKPEEEEADLKKS